LILNLLTLNSRMSTMKCSTAVDYQTSQVNLFMAGITKDLEEHVITKSVKFDFNFELEKPMHGIGANYEWFEVSDFSKSEVGGKKPRINVFNDCKSTADTDILSSLGPVNTSMLS